MPTIPKHRTDRPGPGPAPNPQTFCQVQAAGARIGARWMPQDVFPNAFTWTAFPAWMPCGRQLRPMRLSGEFYAWRRNGD